MFDVDEAFRLPFKLLTFYGFWQTRSSTWRYRVRGFLFIFFTVYLFTFSHFLYLFHYEDIQSLADCISTLLTNIGESLKVPNFIYKLGDILTLIKSLKVLIKFSEYDGNMDHRLIHKRIKRVKLLFKIIVTSAILTTLLAGLVPIFNLKEHKLAYRMYYPYLDHKNDDLSFIIAALYQMSPVFMAQTIFTLDMLSVYFICFATGLLEELSVRLKAIGKIKIVSSPEMKKINSKKIEDEDLKDINSKKNEEEDLKELLKCIEVHQEIKKFVDETQKHFSIMIFVQGVMSSVIFCTIAFTLSLISPKTEATIFVRLTTYAIPMILQIFLPSFYGNEMTHASEQLSTSLFQSRWEDASPNFKKAMKIFMENAKKPIEIAAFGLVKINLGTFTSICNFAYSLYAVFNTVNETVDE